jgi:hypothetical protein
MRLAERPPAELEADLADAVRPDRPNLTQRLLAARTSSARSSRTSWIAIVAAIVVAMLAIAFMAFR